MLSRDSHGPRAVLNALDRLAGSYRGTVRRPPAQDLAIAEGQLRDYEARLGQPFAHDDYLAELTDLRDQLKAGLSEATPEPGPSRCRRPETRRADQGPEIRPHHRRRRRERTAARRIAAEEPVTTRIRQRNGALPVLAPAAEPDLPASAPAAKPELRTGEGRPEQIPSSEATLPARHEEPTPSAVIHPFQEMMPAYRQQVAGSRRQNDRQLRLF